MFGGWAAWRFWQVGYDKTIPGVRTPKDFDGVDVNLFNGTLDSLRPLGPNTATRAWMIIADFLLPVRGVVADVAEVGIANDGALNLRIEGDSVSYEKELLRR